MFKYDKTIEPPSAFGGGASCKFTTSVAGASYHAHFQKDGRFCVYLTLNGVDAARRYAALQGNKEELTRQLGLKSRFRKQEQDDKQLDFKHVGGSVYQVIVYYHEPVAIVDDGRKLRRVRNQARRWVLVLKQGVARAVVAAPMKAVPAKQKQPQPVAG